MQEKQQTAEELWRKHRVYTPTYTFDKLGDTGELIELEPGVKIWSNLSRIADNSQPPKSFYE